MKTTNDFLSAASRGPCNAKGSLSTAPLEPTITFRESAA